MGTEAVHVNPCLGPSQPPHAIYQSPVWRSLVGGVRGRDELVKQCAVQRTRVPPESSKAVKVRYNDGALCRTRSYSPCEF
jgi:hypothetical protein